MKKRSEGSTLQPGPAGRASGELEVIAFESQAAWEAWLEKNHTTAPGVMIRFAKKGSGIQSVTYPQAVEGALCYGWIDGQSRSESVDTYLQRFTPRRSRSVWSKINREKATALIEKGRMKPAGQAEIDRAKSDGRWESAYDSPKSATVPEDLKTALDKNAKAKNFFETLDSRNRYAILHRLQLAKKAETRTKRIDQYVKMLARGEKLH